LPPPTPTLFPYTTLFRSNCPERDVRRLWMHRITDHDGTRGDEGEIGAWLRLGTACGLARKQLLAGERVLPGVRFAVDAYGHFARDRKSTRLNSSHLVISY